MDLAPVIAMNFMCWKFFLYFSGRAAPRGTKEGGAPQTALFLAAASRWWFLLSWSRQKTRRKVDQFGAMTIFVFGDQQRTWSYVELGVLFLFSEITANLLNFAAPPAKKFVPSLGQRFSCGTVLRFEQGGSDHLNSPLVTSASIVPTIGLQTKLEAWMSCGRIMLRPTDIVSLSS